MEHKNLTFAEMMFFLKDGYKAARVGWNGKKMCIFLTEPSEVPYGKCKKAVQDAINCADSTRVGDATIAGTEYVVKINPHVDMVCADGSITCGWVASQTDMMARDWYILQ